MLLEDHEPNAILLASHVGVKEHTKTKETVGEQKLSPNLEVGIDLGPDDEDRGAGS